MRLVRVGLILLLLPGCAPKKGVLHSDLTAAKTLASSGKLSAGDEPADPANPDAASAEAVADDPEQAEASAELVTERAAESEFIAQQDSDAVTAAPSTLPVKPADLSIWASEYDIPIVVNQDVLKWVDYFETRGRKWMTRWLERSTRFIPMMHEVLDKHGVPRDMVYLAMIESGFSTKATSHARAVGAWQFMSFTGRRYGLESDWWIDMRRDADWATDAAARHLKDLYEEFGDWYLAAAGYNAGSGKVRRAIGKYGTRDFWKLCEGKYLRPETKNYVPKLIAAALIAKHPEQFGFTNLNYEQPILCEEVSVPDATGLDVIAKAAGVDVADLELLNPSLRRFCTPPNKAWTVKVPVGSSDTFVTQFATLEPKDRITFRRHKLRHGETLSQVARAYGTGMEAIMRMNGISNPRRMRSGMELMIPVAAYRGQSTPKEEMDRPVESSRRSAVASRPTIPRGYTKNVHIVGAGETLWAIAQQYDVRVNQLKAWNGIKNHQNLRAGQRILIWKAPGAKTVVASRSPAGLSSQLIPSAQAAPADSSGGAQLRYTVRSGDTLWAIAQQHGVSVASILELNGLQQRAKIKPGDVLTIKP